MKKVIICADDFGYSPLFDKMILELLEEGCITTTSVMIDELIAFEGWEARVKQLLSILASHDVSVGLHVYFKSTAFDAEIDRQVEAFVRTFGYLPHYLDLHKNDYIRDGYAHVVQYCQNNSLPCKNLAKADLSKVTTTHEPAIDGTFQPLDMVVKKLKEAESGQVLCVVFHPGYHDPDSTSSLNIERETDVQKARELFEKKGQLGLQYVSYRSPDHL
jgi:predicted glycoside hydrolase/deacetylase ChbG (UPF0249 family)